MVTTGVHEFEIEVRVRKRIWTMCAGDRETARRALKEALLGGMAPGVFARRSEDGEKILDSDFVLEDIQDDAEGLS